MFKRSLSFIFCLFFFTTARSQQLTAFADSVRIAHRIPALGFAVLSADSVFEMHMLGYRKAGDNTPVQLEDKFRIGSNTKAITGMLAALLVKEGKLGWDTPFFSLFPELKACSKKVYHDMTLLQLLTFRNPMIPYTYSNAQPREDQFRGDPAAQRYQFTAWLLQQPPNPSTDELKLSNAGFIAAGLMLEKASGKTYEQLVKALGRKIGAEFGFGSPNATDASQPWGHNSRLEPEPPSRNIKLEWLQAAGNIHVSLPDYTKFMQWQLKGLQGKARELRGEEFAFLHYGLPRFAVGWFWEKDATGRYVSTNTGNPGTFITEVFVMKDLNRAVIFFTNAQTENTYKGLKVLLEAVKKQYGL